MQGNSKHETVNLGSQHEDSEGVSGGERSKDKSTKKGDC